MLDVDFTVDFHLSRLNKKVELVYSWILFGMSHSRTRRTTKTQLKDRGISIWDGNMYPKVYYLEIAVHDPVFDLIICFCRFLHPIIYGEYPKSMQEIVQARLPKFTEEEIKMVKGSIDYVGINQYTAYYMFDPHLPKQEKPTRYQSDWNAGFACKLLHCHA